MIKTTLVLGASLKPERYSYKAVERLVAAQIPVKAFGLKAGEVAGISIDTTLENYPDIHTVSLYIGPQHQESYTAYLLGLKPKRVLFNPGTENAELMRLLQDSGIEVEAACTLVLLATGQF